RKGRDYGFTRGDHEEVEQDQRIDPEQAVDPEIDGDQRGAHGEYRGQVEAGSFRVAGAPGIDHGEKGRQHYHAVGDAYQIVALQQAIDGVGGYSEHPDDAHQGNDRQLEVAP